MVLFLGRSKTNPVLGALCRFACNIQRTYIIQPIFRSDFCYRFQLEIYFTSSLLLVIKQRGRTISALMDCQIGLKRNGCKGTVRLHCRSLTGSLSMGTPVDRTVPLQPFPFNGNSCGPSTVPIERERLGHIATTPRDGGKMDPS